MVLKRGQVARSEQGRCGRSTAISHADASLGRSFDFGPDEAVTVARQGLDELGIFG